MSKASARKSTSIRIEKAYKAATEKYQKLTAADFDGLLSQIKQGNITTSKEINRYLAKEAGDEEIRQIKLDLINMAGDMAHLLRPLDTRHGNRKKGYGSSWRGKRESDYSLKAINRYSKKYT